MLFERATFKNILMCNYVYKTTLICVSASFKNKFDLYYPYEENLWQNIRGMFMSFAKGLISD